MNQISFATSNAWKLQQARDYFAKYHIGIKHIQLDIPEIRDEDEVEVAKAKAHVAFETCKEPLFVMDGGLHILALNGFPATYVKYAYKYIGSEGVIKLLQGKTNRNWVFTNVVYYIDDKREKYFSSSVNGTIAKKRFRTSEIALDPFDDILIPEGYFRPFIHLPQAEQKKIDEIIWKPRVFDRLIQWYLSLDE